MMLRSIVVQQTFLNRIINIFCFLGNHTIALVAFGEHFMEASVRVWHLFFVGLILDIIREDPVEDEKQEKNTHVLHLQYFTVALFMTL